jgi:hypothetical protein
MPFAVPLLYQRPTETDSTGRDSDDSDDVLRTRVDDVRLNASPPKDVAADPNER